jgi:lipopolysaccharide export system permease protein
LKKLHRLVLSTYLGPFIITFFVTLFILVMQFLWKYVDEMVGKGLEWGIIGELVIYASAALVPLALPLAILLSSIMTFGALGEHYELVASKSAGLSLIKVMYPLIIFNFLISILAFYFSNNVLPYANLKSATLLYDIRQKKPAVDISEGVFYKEIDDFVIRVSRKDKNDVLYDVLIYDHREKNGNRKVIRAKEGNMKLSSDNIYLIFSLYDGYSFEEMEGTNAPHVKTYFKEEIIRFNLSEFAFSRSNEELFKDSYKMMNLLQLRDGLDTLYHRRNLFVQDIYERVLEGHQLFRDSIHTQKTEKTDSLLAISYYDTYDNTERSQVIFNNAIAQARRNKSIASSIQTFLEGNDQMVARYYIEWYRKFTLSIACILLFFIGAPLGAIIRKGGIGSPVIAALLFFLVFHVLSITGEKLIRQGQMGVLPGMWMATFVLFPVGIFLTYKATTDSSLLDSEAYIRTIEKIKKLLGIKSKEYIAKTKVSAIHEAEQHTTPKP